MNSLPNLDNGALLEIMREQLEEMETICNHCREVLLVLETRQSFVTIQNAKQ